MASLMRSVGCVFGVGMVLGLGGLMALPSASQERTPLYVRPRIADLPAVPCKEQTWWMMERRCQSWTAPRPGEDLAARPKAAVKVAAAPPPAPPEIRAAAKVAAAPSQSPVPPAPVPPVVEPKPAAVVPALAAAEVAAEWPVAVAAPAPAPMPQEPPPSARETRPELPAAAAQPVPDNTSANPSSNPSSKRKPDATTALANIAVTVRGADKRTRKIMIRPTSRQDVYYYAARPNVAIGNSTVAR